MQRGHWDLGGFTNLGIVWSVTARDSCYEVIRRIGLSLLVLLAYCSLECVALALLVLKNEMCSMWVYFSLFLLC